MLSLYQIDFYKPSPFFCLVCSITTIKSANIMLYKPNTDSVRQVFAETLRFCGWLLFVFFSHSALASFTDSLTVGNAKALALGHAVTADPPGIDSVHFNPAGLTRLKGRQMHIKGVFGLFETNYELGEYGEYQQGLIDQLAELKWPGQSGNLPPEAQAYFYDEALNSKSEVEGPTVMLPGGMVDLPFSGGMMGGASYSPPGSKYTFATNVYAPMMSGYHRADDDPGRFFQRRGAFTLLTYFSPSLAFEMSDEFQVGFSINFSYAGMGLDIPAREPHLLLFYYGHPWVQETFCNEDGTQAPGTPDIYLCHVVSPYQTYGNLLIEADQPLVFGYNAGLLWSPQPWLTFGLAYNSAIKTNLKGKYDFPIEPFFKEVLLDAMNGSLWPTLVAATSALGLPLPTAEQTEAQGSGDINVKYEIPQHLSAGISIQVTPRWKYNLDIKWTEWSAFSDIQLLFDKDIAFFMLGSLADNLMNEGRNGIEPDAVRYQLGLQDVTYWGMGAEFQYNERLALRAGFENRPSAVPDDAPNAFIPINDGILYGAGFSYQFESKSMLDVSIGYMKSESHYPPCSAKLGNGCNPRDVAYPNYQGQDIRSEVSFLLFEAMYSVYF
jgi:long-subunit fatty acid transport protein